MQEYLSWYWWHSFAVLVAWLLVAAACVVAASLVPFVMRKATKSLDWESELTDWALDYGIGRETLSTRLRIGWSIERALTQPVQQKKRKKKL